MVISPSLSALTDPDFFLWAGGIEDTFIPQERPHLRALDEYELMGHYEHWREDLALAKTVGLQALRWGVPWYRVEPQEGHFDWNWTDQVIPYLVEELGITPIIDLMHYGCPLWLKGEFDNDGYPDAVARYAAAFATRYQRWVQWYTPLNEPLINALMCGRRGLWPPYLRGDRGYLRVMLQVVRGIFKTVTALRQIQPEAILVHVDAAGLHRTTDPLLEPLAREEQAHNHLCYDLLTGRVTLDHPLFTWLLRKGVPVADLEGFGRNPITLDVLGLNFYPQWSTVELYRHPRGPVAHRLTEKSGAGFAELLSSYYQRYQVPIMVTETSARGTAPVRAAWLDDSLSAVKSLRETGIPIIGYTWFPLFTMIDWRYRYGRGPVEQYRLELGLYKLGDQGNKDRWHSTPLVERFQAAVQGGTATVGRLHPLPA